MQPRVTLYRRLLGTKEALLRLAIRVPSSAHGFAQADDQAGSRQIEGCTHAGVENVERQGMEGTPDDHDHPNGPQHCGHYRGPPTSQPNG